MILALDIGNTHIVLGCMEGRRIRYLCRMATNRLTTGAEYAVTISRLLEFGHIAPDAFDGAIISSVVPQVTRSLSEAVKMLTGVEPMVVGPGLKTGLKIHMDNPAQVGSDRIVIAVAALAEYKPPLILMDLGTATTLEVVGEDNSYLGGCIIPGVRISLDALTSRTAQLPGIRLEQPKRVIGKNTVDCMRSGIMYGTAAMIDGMLDRIEGELGTSATVVATGGIAQFIIPLCHREIKLEKDLMLKGLNLIYQKNKGKS